MNTIIEKISYGVEDLKLHQILTKYYKGEVPTAMYRVTCQIDYNGSIMIDKDLIDSLYGLKYPVYMIFSNVGYYKHDLAELNKFGLVYIDGLAYAILLNDIGNELYNIICRHKKSLKATGMYSLNHNTAAAYAVVTKTGDPEKDTDGSFIMSDIYAIAKDIISDNKKLDIMYIHTYSDVRSEAIDSIKSLIQNNPNHIIISTAYISVRKYPQDEWYLNHNEDDTKKSKLPDTVFDYGIGILEELGFININSFISYEYSIAYIYVGNEIGKKIADTIL